MHLHGVYDLCDVGQLEEKAGQRVQPYISTNTREVEVKEDGGVPNCSIQNFCKQKQATDYSIIICANATLLSIPMLSK